MSHRSSPDRGTAATRRRRHRAVVGAGVLALLLLTSSSAASASTLSAAAGSLQPGHFASIATGLTGGDLEPDNAGGSIFDWADSGAWDSVLHKFYYVGKEAGGTSHYRNIVYDEASNSWSYGPVPLDTGNGHGYDGNSVDPSTGVHYFRPYNSNTIYKRSGSGWASLPSMSGSLSIVGGLAKSRTGVLYSDAYWDVYYDDATGNKTQVQISSAYPSYPLLGEYHNVAEYDPVHNVYFVGGGNSSSAVFRVTIVNGSPVRTKMNNAPFTFGMGEGAEKVNITADPVTGEFVVYRKYTGDFYGYNIMTDTWRHIGMSGDGSMPPLPTGDNTSPIAAPVYSYGVIMYVAHNGSQASVYIYKHSASGPIDSTPPAPPSQLIAR